MIRTAALIAGVCAISALLWLVGVDLDDLEPVDEGFGPHPTGDRMALAWGDAPNFPSGFHNGGSNAL